MEEFLRRLAAAIRDARSELHLTQEELAERLDVAPETISHFERCRTVPSLRTLFTLAEELKLDLSELMAAGEVSEGEAEAHAALSFAVRDLTTKELTLLADIAGTLKRAR